jgi:tetratricopeptide (TPR) repeat protein
LAITQAAAYLNTNQVSIAEYLGLLRGTEQDMIGVMSRTFQDSTRYRGSQNAVATTWLVSFDQIRKSNSTAADLLSLMSCIEPKAIPRSILPGSQSEEQVVHALGILCAYTFVVRRGESKTFDMHSLVHLATRIWVQKHDLTVQTREKAVRHLAVVFPSNDYANCYLWREYLPHALRALQGREGRDIKETYDLYMRVGQCLQAYGRIKNAVRCFEEAYQWRKSHFPEDHPDRLASQHALALAYKANGQVKEAVELLQQVVKIEESTLAEDHPSRLASQHALASAYKANGQVKEAVELLQQVVKIKETTLAEDHPSRLASQHALASAYKRMGRWSRSKRPR